MKQQIILDEVGNLDAPAGSRPWAIAIRDQLEEAIHDVQFSAEQFKTYVELMEQHKGYAVLGFPTFEDFCEASPAQLGLGKSRINIQIEIDRRRFLEDHGGDRRSAGYRGNQGANKHLEKTGETYKPYILARLERDNPDILADFEAGKYRSARQAGIAAGFVKDRKYIQVAPDPEKIATKLKERLTSDQIDELITLLQS